jgi:hypothetical protein
MGWFFCPAYSARELLKPDLAKAVSNNEEFPLTFSACRRNRSSDETAPIWRRKDR